MYGVEDMTKDVQFGSRRKLGSFTRQGDSPVDETKKHQAMIQSTTGHEKSRGKQGGPPPKAKYYLVTDREQYREGKAKRTPGGE